VDGCKPLVTGKDGKRKTEEGGAAAKVGAYTRPPSSSTLALLLGQGVFMGCLEGIYSGGVRGYLGV